MIKNVNNKSSDSKQRKSKIKWDRRTKPTTLKNIERRKKTHQHRMERKQRHLLVRCNRLKNQLEEHVVEWRDDMTLERYHRNLTRMLRLQYEFTNKKHSEEVGDGV